MSKWKEFKVIDIALNMADAPFGSNLKNTDYTEEGVIIIQGKNIQGRKSNWEDKRFVSIEKYNSLKRHHAKLGTLVFPKVGTIGKIGILTDYKGSKEYVLSTNTMMLETDPEIAVRDFVYYFFSSEEVKNHIQAISSNSVQPVFNFTSLKNYKIKLPSILEQTAIASILSSLDDKIDLLQRQNATLEKMAETLFRQWFVEEAKEEWENIKLGSIVEIINGVSYKSDDLNSSKTAMVTLKSFDRNGGLRMDGFKEYTGKYKEQHILKEGDIVVAHTDITQEAEVIGNPVLIIGNPLYETLVFSMDLVKVVSKSEIYSNDFLYLLMKSKEFKEHCLGYANGSTVLHLSKKAVPEYEIKLPPKKLINDFSVKVKPLFQKQLLNQTQIRILTVLRDSLLPKLMSGEVKVEVTQ